MNKVKSKSGIEVLMLKINIAGSSHITNTYIIYDGATKNGVIVDPAYDGQGIEKILIEEGICIKAIIATHVHADHIGALKYLYESLRNPIIYMHEEDAKNILDDSVCEYQMLNVEVQDIPKEDISELKDGDGIDIDNIHFLVISTPGHTKGSIVLYEKTTDTLFSGDTIFARTYGRTDLKTGSSKDMKQTLDKLFDMFKDVEVLPGHDELFNIKDVAHKIRLLFAYKG